MANFWGFWKENTNCGNDQRDEKRWANGGRSRDLGLWGDVSLSGGHLGVGLACQPAMIHHQHQQGKICWEIKRKGVSAQEPLDKRRNNFFTMKIDMTTCDRMSASSLFILAAMEATASKHSSCTGLNLQIDSISYTLNRAYWRSPIYKGIVAIHATCLAGDEWN